MPLLSKPVPEILENHRRGCVVGPWRHFGEFMQEIWDEAKRHPEAKVQSLQYRDQVKPIGFGLAQDGCYIKTWYLSTQETKALVEAIPNEEDRLEVGLHLASTKGRAGLAVNMCPSVPRPELRK